jgi:hypothetical protein
VLHVVWHRRATATTDAYADAPISPSGAVGAPSIVESAWASLNTSPSLIRTSTGGLALFFSGGHSTSAGDPTNAAGKATLVVHRHVRARVSKSGYRGTTARL